MSIYEGLMPSNKPRVVLYMDEETLEELKEWASEERRSVTNLIKIFIEDALADRKAQKQLPSKKTKEDTET